MPRTEKERAFLRDLFVEEEWTRRFTELADKHIDLKDAENILYINSGTGTHCIELRGRTDERVAVFATCEDEHTLSIARDKAIAASADVDFSMIDFDEDAFDAVIADASFTAPAELQEFVEDTVRVARPGGKVAIMVPSSGSFGEVHSLIWELLSGDDLGGDGSAAETMIAEIPTASRLEQMATTAGLKKVKTHLANEVFEFEDGAAFLSSPLVEEFLLPKWLEEIDEDDHGRVSEGLAALIDAEDGTLTFRFSVKAALLTGEKSRVPG